MDSLLISIVSKYLKEYVNNFRKEQITLNFLGGQGVMRDLDLNVEHINEAFLQASAPALRFTRILINKLSIEAPTILNLKGKPIIIYVDEMFIEICEVPDVVQKPKAVAAPRKIPQKYGFLDRVVDSISFQANKIHLAYRTLGKRKTTAVGLWTPPVLLFEMTGNRYFCTNHNNVECDLEDCFRIRSTKRPMLFVYKKLDTKRVALHLINPEIWFAVADELISGAKGKDIFSTLESRHSGGSRGYVCHTLVPGIPFEIQFCMRKRLDNNR